MSLMAARLDVITEATTSLRAVLVDVDVESFHAADAATVFEALGALGIVVEGAKLVLAKRAADSTRWIDEGHVSPAAWMAEATKSSPKTSQDVLDVAKRLGHLQSTTEAAKAGELSLAKAKEVTLGATADPSTEKELLELATADSDAKLRQRVRQILSAAHSGAEEAAREKAAHERRVLDTWTGTDGSLHLKGQMPIAEGARLLASLEAEAEVVFAEARRAHRRDKPGAYRLDALVNLVTGQAHTGAQADPELLADDDGPSSEKKTTRPRPRSDTVIYVADLQALMRGHVGPGERAEAPGVGPVPVSRIKEAITGGATVLGVVKDVTEISAVVTHNRHVPQSLLAALKVRDDGRCVFPGCGSSKGLEAHHWRTPFAESQLTSLEELASVCHHHHELIHYEGWALEGGHRHWRARPPQDDGLHPVFCDSDAAPPARTDNVAGLFEDTAFEDTA